MAKDFVLTWNAANDNGDPIIDHDVSYTPDGGSEVIVATGSGSAGYTISGLNDGTTYTVKVRAENSGGVGPWSTSVVRLAAIAPGVPTGLATTPDSTTSLSLSWTAPSSDGGSAITGYSIRYTPTAGGSAAVVTLSSTTTNYTITGLAEATSYDVEVAAITAAGTGDYTSAVTGTTDSPSSSSQGSTSGGSTSSQGSTSGGITPNTDNRARIYLPSGTTAIKVGAASTTGYYRITDGTNTSPVIGSSYYATTTAYWYYDFGLYAELTGLGTSSPKTITLYSCDAAGNASGDLVSVGLTQQSQPVDAVDISGCVGLRALAAYSSNAWSYPPYRNNMSGGGSSLPSSITEVRAIGVSLVGSTPAYTPNYYYGGGIDISDQDLDSAQLDQFYTDLAQSSSTGYPSQLIVRLNPGVTADTPSIATAKGYTVYG
jgi:hypothetical protein